MQPAATFDERIASHLDRMSPAERRVVRVFQENREEVLFASAASLAAKASTSDATVVRTTKALGFAGMDELRRTLAAELKQRASITSRMTETLREVGGDLRAAFDLTIDIHIESIQNLRRQIAPETFGKAVDLIGGARRVVIFGIGPSSMMAVYFAIQLGRIGVEAASLVRTGLLFADDLRTLRAGDILVILAYTHVYRELGVLLEEADRHGIRKLLLTDSLDAKLRDRVDLILPVARGRTHMLSMHTATLGLIEALLVGIATKEPNRTVKNLEGLNKLREKIVGARVSLQTGKIIHR